MTVRPSNSSVKHSHFMTRPQDVVSVLLCLLRVVLDVCHWAAVLFNYKTADLYGLTRPVESAIKRTPIRKMMLVRQVFRRVYKATVLFTVTPVQRVGRGSICCPGTAILVVDQRHEALQSDKHSSRYRGTVMEICSVLKLMPSEALITALYRKS